MGSIRKHLSFANVVSVIALFIALGGTAYAVDGSLPGQNTVGSEDIINNDVKSTDIADGKIFNVDLANDVFTGAKVKDDTLTGADVNESTLGKVPSATLGGLGGRPDSASFSCDPESTTFFSCGASAGVDLPAPSRVLVIGEIRAEPDTGNGNGGGSCKVSGMPSPAPVFVNGGQTDVMTVSGITDVLGPGTYSFNMVCNETASGIRYFDGNVNVVALSPDG